MKSLRPLKTLAFSLTAVWLQVAPVHALDMLALQITGASSSAEPLEFSIEALDALEQVSFTTTTIWTDGDVEFSGVSLKALLQMLKLEGSEVELVALNDYAVSMPLNELEDTAPIVATRVNGQPLSVRDKGPYWIVYPYDSAAKYRTETVYSRSIWQLNRLNVID